MPTAFDDASFAFNGTVLTGQPQKRERWKRATIALSGASFLAPMGEAVGQLYVKRHFTPQAKAEMKKILSEIQSGEFADEWMSECDNGKENFKRLESEGEKHQIEEVGSKLRAMMPWLSQETLVNTAKN